MEKLTKTEEAILRNAHKRGDLGYTVNPLNMRKASRDAMAKLRERGLAVRETRVNWYRNWLTDAGMKAAGIAPDVRFKIMNEAGHVWNDEERKWMEQNSNATIFPNLMNAAACADIRKLYVDEYNDFAAVGLIPCDEGGNTL